MRQPAAVAARTVLPVIGVPIATAPQMVGNEALAITAQMPTGVPIATVGVDAAVLGPEAFVMRFFGEPGAEEGAGADRLLLVNLGVDLALDADDLATFAVERWTRDHVVAHIPGSRHDASE